MKLLSRRLLERTVRVAFVLPCSSLFGGIKVALELGLALGKIPGFEVHFLSPEPPPEWFPGLPNFQQTDLFRHDYSKYEVVITTYYDQASIFEQREGRGLLFHFCQGYEGDYVDDLVKSRAKRREIKEKIIAFYSLPYPKLVTNDFLKRKLSSLTYDVHKIGMGLSPIFRKPKFYGSLKDKLLIVGRYDYPFKGIDLSLQLAVQLKKIFPHLRIVRVSPVDTYRQENQYMIDEYHVAVPPQEMPRFYQSSALTLYLARKEGFGLPLLESMASGTPVIASDIEPFREVCGGHLPLFGHLTSALEFAARLLREEELYRRVARRGQVLARRFSYGKMSFRLAALILLYRLKRGQ